MSLRDRLASPAHEAASLGGRVWIVDDSALERENSRRALAERFDAHVFDDGAAVLEALAHRERPDLLILDWQMPAISGRDVCLFVRRETNAAELPIIILTSSEEALVEGLDAGANDYVTKPFRPEELNARAATLVALRRAHEKLFDAEQRLRAEATFRERFIGILAHDLRQPLNTVIMATHLLDREENPSTTTPAARARRAAERMGRMIDELLDFTRSRAGGGMPVTLAEGDLAEIVRRAVNERSEKSSTVIVVEGNTHGAWDADRMAQVCGNLLGNAIEYGAPGAPISVRVIGSPSDVVLEVHNEGLPIPATDLHALFDPFRRGSAPPSSNAASTRHAGLGLGLFIVDQIVQAHGGSMNVRSGEEGTTFTARIPRQSRTLG